MSLSMSNPLFSKHSPFQPSTSNNSPTLTPPTSHPNTPTSFDKDSHHHYQRLLDLNNDLTKHGFQIIYKEGDSRTQEAVNILSVTETLLDYYKETKSSFNRSRRTISKKDMTIEQLVQDKEDFDQILAGQRQSHLREESRLAQENQSLRQLILEREKERTVYENAYNALAKGMRNQLEGIGDSIAEVPFELRCRTEWVSEGDRNTTQMRELWGYPNRVQRDRIEENGIVETLVQPRRNSNKDLCSKCLSKLA